MSTPPPESDAGPGAPRETLAEELSALLEEGRAAAAAELDYQLARVSLIGRLAGRLVGLGLLAVALVFFALMALVVGLLLALVPLLGAWGAMLAVIAGLLAGMAVTLGLIKAGWRRLRRLLPGADDLL